MKMKRNRLILVACVCGLWCFWPAAAKADLSVGPFVFDDLAFADKAIQIEPGHIDFYGASTLDGALTGLTPTAGIVNVGYLSNANLFQLEFLDRMAVNGAGPDVVLFDARFSCNAYAIAVREFGGSYSQFIDFPASKFTNTLVSGPGGSTLYGLPLDLGVFGLASGAIVDAIRFRALPGSNGVTEGDPVMAGVLKGHTISVADTGFSPLPDTGQHECYDFYSRITCPKPGEMFYGQDAHYQGREPAYRANANGTVTDLNTGLVWEQQMDSYAAGQGLQNGKGSWPEAQDYCKSLDLGGWSDWRLPSRMELLTLVAYYTYDPAIDWKLFRPLNWDGSWSSSLDASDPARRWFVDFMWGRADVDEANADHYVRCVRGKPLPAGDYVDNHDGTVFDLTTGLVWQKSGGAGYNWAGALSYCQNLGSGGYHDWWLPDVRELASIVDEQHTSPALDPVFDANPGPYWTGTTDYDFAQGNSDLDEGGYAWTVDSFSGAVFHSRRTDNDNNVRCVRHPALTPKLRFTPVADATVTSSSPTKNYGSVKELEVDGSPLKRFLMKFSVSGTGTRQVINATLHLYCTDSSDHGGDFHRAENGWAEQAVTWKTAPPFDPVAIASLGPVERGSWVSVDITPLITGDGTYSVFVTSSSKEGADYRSREKPELSPRLVVTLK